MIATTIECDEDWHICSADAVREQLVAAAVGVSSADVRCCAWMQTSLHVAAGFASISGSKASTEVADEPGSSTKEAEAPAVSGQEQEADAIEVTELQLTARTLANTCHSF